jgi:hypothetical protein
MRIKLIIRTTNKYAKQLHLRKSWSQAHGLFR